MKKSHIIFIHIIYWFYITFQSLFLQITWAKDKPFLLSEFIFSIGIWVVFFYVMYALLPFLFKKKNKFISVGLGLLIIAVIGILNEFISVAAFHLGVLGNSSNDIITFDSTSYLYHLRSAVVNGIYAVLIYTLIEWLKSLKQQAELISQKQTSELALLRSQVSPHFLFNTLNNIDSLIARDPDKASASVIKLSEIMRYMIYDTSSDKVSISKEIEYLESYISLQRLRLKDPDYISFSVNNAISNKMIAPMIFVSFVENAFKHSLKQMKSPGIIISLNVQENCIFFTATNYFKTDESVIKDKTSGIGLVNVRRRLELIYPNKYDLKIINDNNIYTVQLTIND